MAGNVAGFVANEGGIERRLLVAEVPKIMLMHLAKLIVHHVHSLQYSMWMRELVEFKMLIWHLGIQTLPQLFVTTAPMYQFAITKIGLLVSSSQYLIIKLLQSVAKDILRLAKVLSNGPGRTTMARLMSISSRTSYIFHRAQ